MTYYQNKFGGVAESDAKPKNGNSVSAFLDGKPVGTDGEWDRVTAIEEREAETGISSGRVTYEETEVDAGWKKISKAKYEEVIKKEMDAL